LLHRNNALRQPHIAARRVRILTQTFKAVGYPEFFTWKEWGLTFAINKLSDFKNWHKCDVMNNTSITLFALACIYIYIYIHTYRHTYTYIYICVCVCVCVSRGQSIQNHVNFGLHKIFQTPNSYVHQKLPVYKTPFETPVIMID
jgi:hypothetical protein